MASAIATFAQGVVLGAFYAGVGYSVFRGKLELAADRHQGSGNAYRGASDALHAAE